MKVSNLLWIALASACANAGKGHDVPGPAPTAGEGSAADAGTTTSSTASAGSSHVTAAGSGGTGGSSGSDGGSSSSDGGSNSASSGSGSGPVASARIAAGWNLTCAVRLDGTLWCWGLNATGQIGDGTTVGKLAPVNVGALGSGVAEVMAGAGHTCARTLSGALWCWGDNGHGELGDGTTIQKHAPQQVLALGSGVAAIAKGMSWTWTCARKNDGTAWCWGENQYGALGDGSAVDQHTPVQVAGLGATVVELTEGGHGCARKNDGTVWCWGDNQHGQLGVGDQIAKPTPVAVTALGVTVAQLDAASGHSCALKNDGTVWCWGLNGWGELGDGTKVDKNKPVPIGALGTNVAQISAGYLHTCAVKTDGTLWCWGANTYGALGDGTTVDSSVPVPITALGNSVAEVSAGAQHTCARKTNGTVWCWGYNAWGQVGDGTAVDKHTPTPVLGL